MIPLSYNLRSLAVRRTTTFATAGGLALVVFVFAAARMLEQGVKKTFACAATPEDVIVLRKGAESELASAVEDDKAALVRASSGIRRDAAGHVDAVAEVVVVVLLDKTGTDGFSNVFVRGVEDGSFAFRPGAHIIEGRAARPGTDEAVVGKRLVGRFRGLRIGETFELRKNRPVTVVGTFEDGGASTESEVWVDRDAVRAAFGREGAMSSVRARLASADRFNALKAEVESDPRLDVEVQREADYAAKQADGTNLLVSAVGGIVAFFAALGASIGAAITMSSAVAARRKEIGTLRALGFTGRAILLSFLFESVALALFGGAVGATVSLATRFIRISLMNMANWSEVVFSFEPTASIELGSIALAAVLGVTAGLVPAISAARMKPLDALRAD
jgi:putative ABC transport system permease protein